MVTVTHSIALLAVLITLSACTQNAPAGSIQKNNNTTSAPTNLAQVSPSPSASPAAPVTPDPTTVTVDPLPATTTLEADPMLVYMALMVPPIKNNDGTTASGLTHVADGNRLNENEFVAHGDVAETLYAVLEVEKIQVTLPGGKTASVKVGRDYFCAQGDVTVCVFAIDNKSGGVLPLLDGSKVAAAAPSLVIKTTYNDPGEYFVLSPAQFLSTALHMKDPNDQSKGWEADPKHLVKQASLSIQFDFGKTIYDALTVDAKPLVESDDAKERSEKMGKNVDCVKQFTKKSGQVEYDCKSTLNYDTGAFNIIYTGDLGQILQ